MYYFLNHQWKEKWRSTFWQKNMIVNILLALLGAYLLFTIAFLGYYADQLIRETNKTADLIQVFSRILFYYFSADLIARFFLQSLPTLSIQPYLTLPIKKSRLIHYPLTKSILNFFNILAILLLFPFAFKIIYATHPTSFSVAWTLSLLSLIYTNNYLSFLFKKLFLKKPVFVVIFILCWAGVLYTDFSKITAVSGYFSKAFLYIVNNPVYVIFPLTLVGLSYYFDYILLRKHTYFEETQHNTRTSRGNFSFLSRYGETGNLIRLEIKMILRNKRPKSIIYLSVLFLFYGFLFYRNESMDNPIILFLAGLMLTSMFSLSYGQYLFSWESAYFDTLLTNKIKLYSFIRSKYLFIAVTSMLSFLITLPYMLISLKIGLINAAVLLYNIGISSLIMIFLATYNTSPIDIGRSQFMNYEGTSLRQFVLMVPIIGLPAGIHYVLKWLGIPQYFFLVLAVIGFLGILFNNYLLHSLTKRFLIRRYKMAAAFRQK